MRPLPRDESTAAPLHPFMQTLNCPLVPLLPTDIHSAAPPVPPLLRMLYAKSGFGPVHSRSHRSARNGVGSSSNRRPVERKAGGPRNGASPDGLGREDGSDRRWASAIISRHKPLESSEGACRVADPDVHVEAASGSKGCEAERERESAVFHVPNWGRVAPSLPGSELQSVAVHPYRAAA